MSSKKQKIADKDRYSIIVPYLDKCYICGSKTKVEKHEVFYGVKNRPLSIEDGMVIPLCSYHHNSSNQGVHRNKDLDIKLKQMAQRIWMDKYCNKNLSKNEQIEQFIKRYGQNYLFDEYKI